MGEHGFIRDMLDVKVLVLYVMSRAEKPLTVQEIYALCYQDDRLTYFDVCEAVPQLAANGNLHETADGCYEITEKGRENAEITADSVAFTVRERAKAAVERFISSPAIKTMLQLGMAFCATSAAIMSYLSTRAAPSSTFSLMNWVER